MAWTHQICIGKLTNIEIFKDLKYFLIAIITEAIFLNKITVEIYGTFRTQLYIEIYYLLYDESRYHLKKWHSLVIIPIFLIGYFEVAHITDSVAWPHEKKEEERLTTVEQIV